jgi:hypothetical protein
MLHNCSILVENKFSTNEPIRVKVTDFGLSRNPDAQYMTSALGTLVIIGHNLALDGS